MDLGGSDFNVVQIVRQESPRVFVPRSELST